MTTTKPTTLTIIAANPIARNRTDAKLLEAIKTDGSVSLRAVSLKAKMSVMAVMHVAKRLAERGLIQIN
jgi:DNA-binding Lrp family transcriptional regulator